jgi:hypothetical protein
MHYTNLQRHRDTYLKSPRCIVAVALLLSAACVDSPTTPTPPAGLGASAALVNKPPVDQTLEGQAWVCKDGSGPATNFNFEVSIDGGAGTKHTIALGTCALVHSVSTIGQTSARVSVSEAVPAGWTLDGITIESNLPPLHNPVINPPNASATIKNDVGVVITFTNTVILGPSCTRTQGYWKTHGEVWDQAGDGKPFLTTTTFYNTGTSYLTIFNTAPKNGNAYLQLAHQFIAASLNLNGALSGIAPVDAAMAGSAAYFAGAPAGIPNPADPTRSQLQAWATTLDNFNNGVTGPGHCPD